MSEQPTQSAESLPSSVADSSPTIGDVGTSRATDPLPVASTRYILGDELAHGGMGIVHRATDTVLGREVAIKILREKYTPETAAARRFANEARITGQLQHPAIPPVHDLGTLPDGRPFLAMKLIRGDTLDELLDSRLDPTSDRGRYIAAFEQVCQAVAFAHAHSVIHRDLKPANVMVGNFGEVQVMDWGLAKVLTSGEPEQMDCDPDETLPGTLIQSLRESQGTYTQAGSVLGTPAFMPPEQAVGAVGKVDARSDVFGLGAILAVILTGRPPFASSSAETTRIQAAQGKVDECFARLDACGADPELVALCKQCLSPIPLERPADAGEVARAVAGLRSAAEDRARQAELDRVAAETRAREQRKRRLVQSVLGLTLTVVVGLVGFGFWWQERQQSVAAANLAARQSRTTASVVTALEDARKRIDEAWQLSDEPDKMRVATDLALAGVHRAEGFTNSGDPTPESLEELSGVRQKVDELERYTRLFVAADLALRAHDIGDAGAPDGGRTTQRLALAFRQFGWDPVHAPAVSIANEIVASRARNKVLGFLCDWEFQSSQDQNAQLKIRDVIGLARLHSGGLLAQWQAVADENNPDRLVEFASGPEVLTLGPELLCALGRDLNRSGKFDALMSLLRRAVDRYPTHVWINFDLMHAYHRLNPPRPAEVLRYAAAATTARPHSALLQENLGGALIAYREYDEAALAYRRALAIAPNSVGAQEGLAQALQLGGKGDAAISAYRELLRLVPGSASAHFNLARCLADNGKMDEALTEYSEAGRLDPNRYKSAAEFLRQKLSLQQRGLLGHTNVVYGVAFTPDDHVVSACWDGTVRIWDHQKRRTLQTLRTEPINSVRSLAIRPTPSSPTPYEVIGGTNDGRIVIWRPDKTAPIETLIAHSSSIHALVVAPAGDVLFSASNDKTVKVWNPRNHQPIKTLEGHTSAPFGMAIRPDGKQLATVARNGELILWNLVSGEKQIMPRSVTGDAVAYSPDGSILATGGPNSAIRLWNPRTGKSIRDLAGPGGVICLAFAPGGRVLASCSTRDNTIRLWDVESGMSLHTLAGHESWLQVIAFSPDGRRLASGGWDKIIGMWELPPSVRERIRVSPPVAPLPHEIAR